MRSKEVEEAIEEFNISKSCKLYGNTIIVNEESIDIVLAYIEELEKENKRLYEREEYLEKRRTDIINKFQNEITDTTIPKQILRNKINNTFELYHERYELDYIEVRELISEIHRKILKELLEEE